MAAENGGGGCSGGGWAPAGLIGRAHRDKASASPARRHGTLRIELRGAEVAESSARFTGSHTWREHPGGGAVASSAFCSSSRMEAGNGGRVRQIFGEVISSQEEAAGGEG